MPESPEQARDQARPYVQKGLYGPDGNWLSSRARQNQAGSTAVASPVQPQKFDGLTGHWLHRGYSMFILADRVTDAPLGSAGPWFPEGWPEPEIGWSIWDQGAEGRGLAHEAALATRAYAYENLGWTTAISLILDGNVKSQALALRMGCHLESDFTHEQFGKCNIYRHPQRVPA